MPTAKQLKVSKGNQVITKFFQPDAKRQVDENFNSQAVEESDTDDNHFDKDTNQKHEPALQQRKPLADITDITRVFAVKPSKTDTQDAFVVLRDEESDTDAHEELVPIDRGQVTQTVPVLDTLPSQVSAQSSPFDLDTSDKEGDSDDLGLLFTLDALDEEGSDPFLDDLSDPFITKTITRFPSSLPAKRPHASLNENDGQDDDEDEDDEVLIPDSLFGPSLSPPSRYKQSSQPDEPSAKNLSSQDATSNTSSPLDEQLNDSPEQPLSPNLLRPFEYSNNKALTFSLAYADDCASPSSDTPLTRKSATSMDSTISMPLQAEASLETHVPYPNPRGIGTVEKFSV
ncbi:hypothetical protein DM01DRAFT_1411637 [Hesseltinella vesiculosa]|uniref:Uncharacterized protein n=1 Tax=Hesseltinella vesiculosa TaxID=101127 RepID=A0A1X2G325_9FUNG|nr:hypothetical protein DM01DRAFT_1411637 [Hesseltinella vesiculosa]